MNNNDLFNFFAYVKSEDGEIALKRIRITRDLQRKLSKSFVERREQFIPDDEDKILKFGDYIQYKPEFDELFVIENFELTEDIINAISNPINIDDISENDYDRIKAIFCSRSLSNTNYEVIFTTFDSRKIIKSTKLKTIVSYTSGTFTDIESKMIVIEEKIDVLFKSSNNNLYFHSFANAKKIFGDLLNQYYREATGEEIKEFSIQLFDSEIPEDFVDFNSRKLIFGIMKKGIPETQKIVDVGKKKFEMEIEINEMGKLKIPNNKKIFKKLLKLLNDNLLESPLTDIKYETNSKRKIS